MLIFLSGTDSYLAKKAIDGIKAKYLQKNSGAELIEIDGGDAAVSNFADLQAVPLFATSRLAILRRTGSLSKDRQKDLASFLGNLPATTVAVAWDGSSLAEGSELLSVLKSAAKTIAVSPLQGTVLRNYLKKYAANKDFPVATADMESMISIFGSDLWSLTGEIDRLSLGGTASETKKNIESEKFVYFRLARNRAWSKVGEQLKVDLENGVPIELTLGMLAAAIRKEVVDKKEKLRLTDLMIDLDYGLKTGWLDPESLTALLMTYLPKSPEKRVVWELAWQKRGY